MLSPLTLTGLGVVLLPGETSLLPAFVDSFHEVLAKVRVQLLGTLAVRALGLSDVLYALVYANGLGGTIESYKKLLNSQIVHVYPNRSPPVVLASVV